MGYKTFDIYKPADTLSKRFAQYKGVLLADIYKYQPDYIENAIMKYPDFAIDMEAFEKLSPPTPVYSMQSGYDSDFIKLNKEINKGNPEFESIIDSLASVIDKTAENKKGIVSKIMEEMTEVNFTTKLYKLPTTWQTYQDEVKRWHHNIDEIKKYNNEIKTDAHPLTIPPYPRLSKNHNPDWPVGLDLIRLVEKLIADEGYRPKQYLFEFSPLAKEKNQEKIFHYYHRVKPLL